MFCIEAMSQGNIADKASNRFFLRNYEECKCLPYIELRVKNLTQELCKNIDKE